MRPDYIWGTSPFFSASEYQNWSYANLEQNGVLGSKGGEYGIQAEWGSCRAKNEVYPEGSNLYEKKP